MLVMGLSKACMLLFHLRITPHRVQRVTCYALIGVCALWTIAAMVAVGFRCGADQSYLLAGSNCFQFVSMDYRTLAKTYKIRACPLMLATRLGLGFELRPLTVCSKAWYSQSPFGYFGTFIRLFRTRSCSFSLSLRGSCRYFHRCTAELSPNTPSVWLQHQLSMFPRHLPGLPKASPLSAPQRL